MQHHHQLTAAPGTIWRQLNEAWLIPPCPANYATPTSPEPRSAIAGTSEWREFCCQAEVLHDPGRRSRPGRKRTHDTVRSGLII